MAFNTNLSDTLGTGTDQELLDSFRACLIRISVAGQSYQMKGGRIYTAANITEVRKTIDWLETRIAAADTGGFAVNYATRGRAL